MRMEMQMAKIREIQMEIQMDRISVNWTEILMEIILVMPMET